MKWFLSYKGQNLISVFSFENETVSDNFGMIFTHTQENIFAQQHIIVPRCTAHNLHYDK
jgi:hypothetical protein